MDDYISRRAAINVIERNRAYIGHNMERAVGAAFIEILNCVGEDIGRLPSIQLATDTNVGTKLGTDLAQLGTDCISRQAAIDALAELQGRASTKAELKGISKAWKRIKQLQPIQPVNNSENPNSSDAISRQQAIDAVDKRFDSIPMEQTSEILLLRKDLRELPPAEPKRIRGKWIYCEDSTADCVDGYRCDQCGLFVPWDYKHKGIDFIQDYNFCPHCGSYNGGKNEI